MEMAIYKSDWEGGTQGRKMGAGEMGLQCLSQEFMGAMSRVSPSHRTSSTKNKHQDSKFFDFPFPLATDDSFHIVHSVTDRLKTSCFLGHWSCTGLRNHGCG